MTNSRINGAGISGLACARLMADAGLNVIGVATRRARAKGAVFRRISQLK
jgi:flavin-dependent dehydrogenase